MYQLLRAMICLGFMGLFSGCMDGPFYHLKRLNPYYISRWNADRKYGPTFDDRMNELQDVEKRLPAMDLVTQNEWSERFEELIRDDPSPELRCVATRCVATIDSPAAERALNTASADEIEKVRFAACKAWEKRGDAKARDMLLSLAQADESNTIRQAAVVSLASFNDPEVLRTLGNLMEDPSPAIQYNVAQSLATLTGENYGGDVEGWKKYLAANVPPAVSPTLPKSDSASNPVMTASGPNQLPQ